jgi:hypothetical protein
VAGLAEVVSQSQPLPAITLAKADVEITGTWIGSWFQIDINVNRAIAALYRVPGLSSAYELYRLLFKRIRDDAVAEYRMQNL